MLLFPGSRGGCCAPAIAMDMPPELQSNLDWNCELEKPFSSKFSWVFHYGTRRLMNTLFLPGRQGHGCLPAPHLLLPAALHTADHKPGAHGSNGRGDRGPQQPLHPVGRSPSPSAACVSHWACRSSTAVADVLPVLGCGLLGPPSQRPAWEPA